MLQIYQPIKLIFFIMSLFNSLGEKLRWIAYYPGLTTFSQDLLYASSPSNSLGQTFIMHHSLYLPWYFEALIGEKIRLTKVFLQNYSFTLENTISEKTSLNKLGICLYNPYTEMTIIVYKFIWFSWIIPIFLH